MTPPRALTSRLAALPLLRDRWIRRGLLLALITACALLALYPRDYRASTVLALADPASRQADTALGAPSGLLGNRSAIEATLAIARSDAIHAIVSGQARLEQRLRLAPVEARAWLDRSVAIDVIRGKIMKIALTSRDPEFAREVVTAYGEAVRSRLAAKGPIQGITETAVLEPARIERARQLNAAPLALGVLLLLFALALEFHSLRPPLSETRMARANA
jgi:tyrosine-protein kinase Etk/Wzc